ncbi:uncharacterized protein TRAVEDRAFT_49802 [Trametes versicolor FP-101664 SS1]|uniref:uncharacterized protein n=1 Tax=Trametes versicolor (strain FP-101664) TaxID=717944 RepID=UPI0004623D83|nr:uncharacterized protein TRAVEDRAFT_49802 [Trametes versicolor FP-101664 SS1]EIW56991.1 hypothetical protein TRAVEDRAFT_49802 [Trametes versicolor FP-101664 SS1]
MLGTDVEIYASYTPAFTLSGFVLSSMLYAVLSVQAFEYPRKCAEDRTALKVFVAMIFLLATSQQALFATIAWFTLVKSANPEYYGVLSRTGDVLSVLSTFTTVMVQIFYVTRTISRISLVLFVHSLLPRWHVENALIVKLNTVVHAFMAATDLLAPFILSCLLVRAGSGTRRSLRLTRRLVLLQASRGVFTTAVQILIAVALSVSQDITLSDMLTFTSPSIHGLCTRQNLLNEDETNSIPHIFTFTVELSNIRADTEGGERSDGMTSKHQPNENSSSSFLE